MTVNRKSLNQHYNVKHGGTNGKNWKELVTKKRPKEKITTRNYSRKLTVYNLQFTNIQYLKS